MRHCATDSMMRAETTDYLSLLRSIPNHVVTVSTLAEALKLLEKYGRLVVKEASFKHKAKHGNVFLNVVSRDKLVKLWHKLKQPIAQPMVSGYEFIVSKFHDRIFGNLIMLGSGSFLAEALDDKVIFKLPISRKEAKMMVEEVFLSRFIKKKLLIEYLLKFSRLPLNVEVNPLIVSDRVYAVDVRPT